MNTFHAAGCSLKYNFAMFPGLNKSDLKRDTPACRSKPVLQKKEEEDEEKKKENSEPSLKVCVCVAAGQGKTDDPLLFSSHHQEWKVCRYVCVCVWGGNRLLLKCQKLNFHFKWSKP